MTVARYAHTATLLSNGTVLIAGGCYAGGDCVSSAEIYNPSTGTFTATGSMLSKRWGHTATLLPSGSVLITGGCTGGGTCLATAELYNPNTGTFSMTGNSMSAARYTHAATLLDSGLVLVTGGCRESGNCNLSADLYNPNTNLFAATGNMEYQRWGQTSTLLQSGSVLIAGGCTGGGDCLASTELYNPSTGTFTLSGTMVDARYDHTATLLATGYVLMAGGCSGNGTCRATAELYNPTTGTFAATGNMTIVRYAQTAASLFDGTVLIAGGCESSGNCTASAEIYNPTSGSFAAVGSMTSKRYSYTATLLTNGKVLEAGGCTGGGSCLATADLFNGPAPVSGYVSPKYLVIGVQYAPPGSKSSVVYAESTMMGTSTTYSNSFTNKQTDSVSLGFSVGAVFGIFGNEPNVSYTATFSSGFSEQTDSSNSVSINSTQSNSNSIPGPSSDYVGVDHSQDIITVWLNPVLIFGTLPSNPNLLQMLGNTYDLVDPISGDSGQIDTVSLTLAQWQNPSLIPTYPLNHILNRGWEFDLQGGAAPGLTTADFNDIASADPFSSSTYSPTFNTTTHCSTDGRFCASALSNGKSDISYQQPNPGGQPEGSMWGQGFTIMASQNAGYKDSHTVGYSLDANLTDGFLSGWAKLSLKDSQTLTWTNQYSSTSTNTTGQTATFNVVGPACVVPSGGSACNPVYTGPTEFELFEDTVYRSFMFYPAQ
jgi:Galactose oxidase, central domain/Kelch motif